VFLASDAACVYRKESPNVRAATIDPPDSIRAKYALDPPSRRNQFPEFLSILNAIDSDFHLAVRPHLSAMPTLGFQSNGRGRVRGSRHAGIILATSSLAAAADSVLELVEFLGDGV
jgi:hypothetical protein